MNFYIKCNILLSAPDASWHKSYNIKGGEQTTTEMPVWDIIYWVLSEFIYSFRWLAPVYILEVHTSKQFQFYFPSPWIVLMLLGLFFFFKKKRHFRLASESTLSLWVPPVHPCLACLRGNIVNQVWLAATQVMKSCITKQCGQSYCV